MDTRNEDIQVVIYIKDLKALIIVFSQLNEGSFVGWHELNHNVLIER